MVMPPEADPVRAASTFVATASETSGPPPIPSTQSLTNAEPGRAATTAPKPTRLATLKAGSTEALAPASMLWRKADKRDQLTMMTVAAARAAATDQTPPTADRDVAPHLSSARKDRSSDGRTMRDIARLTPTTTASGSTASATGGPVWLCWPHTPRQGRTPSPPRHVRECTRR